MNACYMWFNISTGPLAFMFHSTHEQSYIGHVLAFSLCIGHFKDQDLCQTHPRLAAQKNENILNFSLVRALIGISAGLLLALICLIVYFITQKKKGQNFSINNSEESGNCNA